MPVVSGRLVFLLICVCAFSLKYVSLLFRYDRHWVIVLEISHESLENKDKIIFTSNKFSSMSGYFMSSIGYQFFSS